MLVAYWMFPAPVYASPAREPVQRAGAGAAMHWLLSTANGGHGMRPETAQKTDEADTSCNIDSHVSTREQAAIRPYPVALESAEIR